MDDDVVEKLKSMLNNGNIQDNINNMLSNMNNSKKEENSSTPNISPDTINNLLSAINSANSSNSDTSSSSNTNTNSSSSSSSSEGKSSIDFETILKLKNIMEKLNSKDDSRSRLLISLKPYLKESRKNKLDQYIQLMNMTKVMEVFSKAEGDKK